MIPKPTIKWTEKVLSLSELATDYKFQVRASSLNHEQAMRYASQMEHGAKFPPITVALIGKRYHVLDGFHRLAAARHVGRDQVRARVARMDSRTAQAVAIDANVANGLPLNYADRESIFSQYCRAGLHLGPHRALKSRRVMQKELASSVGTNLSLSTITRWLETYAPKYPLECGGGGKRQMDDDVT